LKLVKFSFNVKIVWLPKAIEEKGSPDLVLRILIIPVLIFAS